MEAVKCDVPLEILLAVGRFDPMQLAEEAHHNHSHLEQSFNTWCFETERPCLARALVKKKST